MRELPTLPVTYRPSRVKMLLLLALSAVFVVGGIWMFPERPWIGGGTAVFFGLCGLVGIVTLLPGASHLTLTTQGFWFASLFREHFVAWKDVGSFSVAHIQTQKMVGWNYTTEFKEQVVLRRVSSMVAGIEGGLPDTYGHEAEDLARLMNELRARFAASPGNSFPVPPS